MIFYLFLYVLYCMLMTVDMLIAVGCAVIAIISILYIINTYIYLQTDYYYLTQWTQRYWQRQNNKDEQSTP